MKTIFAFVVLGLFCTQAESYHRRPFNDENSDFFEIMDAAKAKSHKSKPSKGHGWNYLFSGPSTWEAKCEGKKQSPINIDSRTLLEKAYQKIEHNYKTQPNTKYYGIVNNGHALQINFNSDTKYRFKKNGVMYTPLQVHMHFNPFTLQGSEHTFNKKKYFAEIHIVHKRTNGDGLLVIGMFIDLGKENSYAANAFSKVANVLIKPGSSGKINAFKLANLFPKGSANYQSKYAYANYFGSLTTPPCSEIVDWIVVTGRTLTITPDLVEMFKKVRNGANGPMGGDGGNNRPVQKIGNRKVTGVMKGFF